MPINRYIWFTHYWIFDKETYIINWFYFIFIYYAYIGTFFYMCDAHVESFIMCPHSSILQRNFYILSNFYSNFKLYKTFKLNWMWKAQNNMQVQIFILFSVEKNKWYPYIYILISSPNTKEFHRMQNDDESNVISIWSNYMIKKLREINLLKLIMHLL